MTHSEIAKQWFADTFNCAQSVLASFGQAYGLTDDQCLKIGCAFGGGMARRQMTCGAVTGALVVLGLQYGRGAGDPYSSTEMTYKKSLELFDEFKMRNGSINCRELLKGLDMNDPEDKKKIAEFDLFKTSCTKYVQDAAEITEKLITSI